MPDDPGGDGYVRGIDYTHGYCAELAPALLDLACVSRGCAGRPNDRPLKYLELGYGQGVSLNIHAAACAGEFWGIDFNPAHAANALELAAASGSGVRVLAESFEAFAAREDVPQFDVIAMHGTWSWISAANRHLVVEIVRRRLAPGGVFFVSYNCLPGWSSEIPLRHLLVQHAELAAAPGQELAARIDDAIGYAQALSAAGARFFRAHGALDAWLADMRTRSSAYLAHEYFNRDWHPMPFAEAAQALRGAGLGFVASAVLSDNLEGIGLAPEARAMLAAARDPAMRETVFDYLTNRRLRRDIFTKGGASLSPEAREARLRDIPFTLLQHPDHVPARVQVTGGEAGLDPSVLRPLVAALAAGSYAPKTLSMLEADPRCSKAGFAKLCEAVLLLASAGSLHPAQSGEAISAAAPRCKALNARLIWIAATKGHASALASPVTGAGVYAARREMLFLHAIALGITEEDEWASHALECMKEEGTASSDLAGLQADARAFACIRLPVLRALRVA